MAKYEVADAFVEVLTANGVEDVFLNPGGDIVPLMEAISRYQDAGKRSPRGVLCLHESVAMTAAHGNYMVSGRPQVVLVHSELGTQQVGGALHNAQWGRIPIVMCCAPRGPAQRVNWLNEPFDQGRIVRDCVKWDHQLGDNEDIHDVLQQALRIANTEPCGPVYLTIPRETMTQKIDRVPNLPAAGVASPPEADVTALSKAAELLINADNPLIKVGYSGRHPQAVASLVELAETLGARVVTAEVWMNFPTTHPLCAWTAHSGGARHPTPYIATADVLLVIDYDIPYASTRDVPGPDTKVIHIDIDTVKLGVPIYNRPADVLIEADSSKAIPALTEIIRQRLIPEQRTRFQERFKRLEREHDELRSQWRASAMSKADQKPISADWFCRCLAEVIDDDTIIMTQILTGFVPVAEQIFRTKPGTLFACAGGSMQWALGAALGAKLADPDKTVVSLTGDGAFVYGCPVASLWPASYYRAPFLSVIFNNRVYGAIKNLFQKIYEVDNMGADIAPSPDYALVAQSCGAYGRMLEDPADVLPALREALDQVRSGRPAVLDVRM